MSYGYVKRDIMKDTELTLEAKGIYAYLSSVASSDKECYPSIATITQDLGITKVRFQKHFKMLKEKGYITVSKHKNDGKFENNVYTINHGTVSLPRLDEPGYDFNTSTINTKTLSTLSSLKDYSYIYNKSIYQSCISEDIGNIINQEKEIDRTDNLIFKDLELYNKDLQPLINKSLIKLKSMGIDISSVSVGVIDYALANFNKNTIRSNPEAYFLKCLQSAFKDYGLMKLRDTEESYLSDFYNLG